MAGFITRPIVTGRKGVVTSGHYLATAAGFRIMENGGNAIDAAAAMCIAVDLMEPQSCGIGGEVPTLIYPANEGKVYALSGLGWSPQAFTIDWCKENDIDLIPGDGYLPITVPAVVGTWAEAVARWGTKSFSEILAPTIDLAENGFALYEGLWNSLAGGQRKFTELYPSTGEVYLPNGEVPEIGDLIRNPDYAEMLRIMCRAEESAKGKGRVAGIEAARDAFYKGEIAERILDFITTTPVEDATGRAHTALLSYDDIAEWQPAVEESVMVEYRGLEVHKCSTWTQGPVFLQQLTLLEGYNLASMGHNSAEYIHTLVEASKLAFADREAYYGDPDFDDVPLDKLLSKEYAAERRALIGEAASMEQRPGDIGMGIPEYVLEDVAENNRRALGVSAERPRRPWTQPRARERHDPPRRHRRGGQHGLGHAQRRMDRLVARHQGAGPAIGHEGADVLPQPRPSKRAGAAKATARHPDTVDGHQERRAVDGVWDAGGRQPGPDHAPVLAELRRFRDEHAGGGRRADLLLEALPVLFLPAEGVPRSVRHRGQGYRRGGG